MDQVCLRLDKAKKKKENQLKITKLIKLESISTQLVNLYINL